MNITNYEGLRVILRPGPLSDNYEFVVENQGELQLWDLRLDVYALLGPGAFGLDDTHMQSIPQSQKTAVIDSLGPGASICISQETWPDRTRFKVNSKRRMISGTFLSAPTNEQRYGLRADFVTLGLPTTTAPDKKQPHARLAFCLAALRRSPAGIIFRRMLGRRICSSTQSNHNKKESS